MRERGRERNLEAGAAEDTNGGSGPSDLGVEVIEPFPSLIEAYQSWYEHNFASIAQTHRLPFGLDGIVTVDVRVWARRFTHRHF